MSLIALRIKMMDAFTEYDFRQFCKAKKKPNEINRSAFFIIKLFGANIANWLFASAWAD